MTIVGDLSEEELLAAFVPRLPSSPSTIVGPGDDAAVLGIRGSLVTSSDVLVQGRHFRTEWASAEDIGYRAAIQNLADIDAMGAVPRALQVTLVMPPDTPVDWVVGCATGLRDACEPHEVGVVGGDLASGRDIVISVTVLGESRDRLLVTRSGATPGALVAVAGHLGAAAAGLHQCENDTTVVAEATKLFLRPAPRIGAGVVAARAGANAMIDLSDGLVTDARRLAQASGLTVNIHSADVPVHSAAEAVAKAFDVDPMSWALTGGEDHHLLATFPSGTALPEGWYAIGQCAVGPAEVRVDGQVPTSWGWDHFGA